MARGIGESIIDLSDQTIEDLAAAIRSGAGGGNPSDTVRTNGAGGAGEGAARADRAASGTAQKFENLKKQADEASKGFGFFARNFNYTVAQQFKASQSLGKLNQSIRDLENEIDKLSEKVDDESKEKVKVLTDARNSLVKKKELDDKVNKNLTNTIGFAEKLAKNYQAAQFAIAQAQVQGQNAVLNAAQSGAGGFQIAAAQMAADTNIAAAQINGMITQVQSASSALSALGPAGAAAAAVIQYKTQEQLNKNAIAVQQALQAQKMIVTGAENVFKGFQLATSAGAFFAKGADGMANAFKGTNITMKEAGELIKANASLLSEANVGVAAGAEHVGKVFAKIQKGGYDKGFAAIGFGLQETGTAIAQVMSDMKRQDPRAKLNDEVVFQRTKEYAVNLATISSIQGKTVKQLQDEMKERKNSLMFQQFINSLGPKGNQVEQAFNAIPVSLRKAVGQIADPRLGTIIDKQVAVMAQLNPALGSMLNELGIAARNGVLTPEMAGEIQAKYKDAISKSVLDMGNFGMAIAQDLQKGTLKDIGETLLIASRELNKWGGEASSAAGSAAAVAEQWKTIRSTMENIAAGKGTDGGAVDLSQTLLTIDKAGRDITKSIETNIIAHMPAIGEMILAALRKSKAQIDEYLANGLAGKAAGGAQPMDYGAMLPYVIAAVLAVIATGALMRAGAAVTDKVFEKIKGKPPTTPPGGGAPHGEPHGPAGGTPHESAPSRTTTATPHGEAPPRAPNSMDGWKNGETARSPRGANPNIPAGGQSREAAEFQRQAAAAKEAAEKSAKAATEASIKETEKVVAKQATKSGLKKIPFLAILFGLGFAAEDVMAGDYVGAAANVTSGALGSLPFGFTQAAGAVVDVGDTVRRVNNANEAAKQSSGVAPTAGPNGEKLIRMPNGTLGYQKASRNGMQFVPLVNGKFGDSMDYNKAYVANGGAMPTSTVAPTTATTASQKVATNGMPTINLSSDSIASMATAFQNAFKDSVIKNAVASVPTKANAAVSSKTINMDELNKLGKSDPTLFALSSLLKNSDDQKKIVEKTQTDSKKQMEELIQAIELMAEKAGVSATEIKKLRKISQ
jgi:hypothetical protein